MCTHCFDHGVRSQAGETHEYLQAFVHEVKALQHKIREVSAETGETDGCGRREDLVFELLATVLRDDLGFMTPH